MKAASVRGACRRGSHRHHAAAGIHLRSEKSRKYRQTSRSNARRRADISVMVIGRGLEPGLAWRLRSPFGAGVFRRAAGVTHPAAKIAAAMSEPRRNQPSPNPRAAAKGKNVRARDRRNRAVAAAASSRGASAGPRAEADPGRCGAWRPAGALWPGISATHRGNRRRVNRLLTLWRS